MKQFRVTYFLEVKHGNLFREGRLPFVPHSGLMIDPGDGNFWRAETVYFNRGAITCFLVGDSAVSLQTLKSWGWLVEK